MVMYGPHSPDTQETAARQASLKPALKIASLAAGLWLLGFYCLLYEATLANAFAEQTYRGMAPKCALVAGMLRFECQMVALEGVRLTVWGAAYGLFAVLGLRLARHVWARLRRPRAYSV